MSTTDQYVLFRLDTQQHALPLGAVERIVQAVAVTPLPEAPALILGVINVQGRIIPVVSARRLYGQPVRPVAVDDHFIIAHTGERTVALVVDAVLGVSRWDASTIIAADAILATASDVQGVSKTADGLILLHDPRRLLGGAAEYALEPAPAQNAGAAA